MTMMTESNKNNNNGADGSSSMNLGLSLNIVVAVAKDNSQAEEEAKSNNNNNKTKRKKKMNKYEKRRRKAAAAAVAAVAAASNISTVSDAPATTSSTSTNTSPGTTTTTKANDVIDEKDDEIQHQEEEEETAGDVKKKSSNKTTDNPKRQKEEKEEEEDDDGTTNTNKRKKTVTTTTKDNDNDDNVDVDEDHAAYMAEYHARPLELDRRSGATIKKIRKSTRTTTTTADAAAGSSEVFSKESVSWNDLNLDPKIVNLLPHSKPTKIQENVIRKILKPNGTVKNFWIQSETGSGKTLAYFLPILQTLWQSLLTKKQQGSGKAVDRVSIGTQCLIICPTQELVQQTHEACERLTTKLCAGQLVVGILRGQASKSKEKARIRKGLGVLVSTPGRLVDHLQTTVCLQTAVRRLQWLVLDEVDRLFDMGLSPQLKQVVELLQQFVGRNCQWRSTLVSATVPPEVKETVQTLLSSSSSSGSGSGGKTTEWAWIQQQQQPSSPTTNNNNSNQTDIDEQQQGVGATTTTTTTGGRSLPKQLVQYHILVSAKLRLTTLIAFLIDRVNNNERTVVFLSTCASVDYLHELFNKADSIVQFKKKKQGGGGDGDDDKGGLFGSSCTVDRLHGNVPHQQRQSILQSFTEPTRNNNNNNNKKKTPQARILLATDVAARGLNLHADWTVQYDPPCEIADYIHRAGRVARAGQMGQSLLFLLPSEKSLLGILQLKQNLKNTEKEIPAVSLTSTLQQAAKLCPDLMRAGLQRNGMMRKSLSSSTKDIPTDSSSSSSSSRSGGSRQGEAFCSELQYRLEECVLEHSKTAQRLDSGGKNKKKRKKDTAAATTLLDMARAAFLSHMRAYPTKEKLVRHIFSARALHLGHIAKSFALREPPKTLVKNSRGSVVAGFVGSNNNKKKRSATAAFGGNKQGKGGNGNNHDSDDEFSSTNNNNGKTSAQKRAMLMANAAKLQMGGIDGF